jgi:hypothetical protein
LERRHRWRQAGKVLAFPVSCISPNTIAIDGTPLSIAAWSSFYLKVHHASTIVPEFKIDAEFHLVFK